jgi:anti-sigma factor RsiW
VADLSDEMLMAYADEALDPAEQAGVEAAIERRPDYQAKVAKFRATRKPVQQAINDQLNMDRIAPLVARIRGDERRAKTAGHGGARIFTLPGARVRTSSTAPRTYWPMAIAASCALLIGGGFGWFTRGATTSALPASPAFVAFSAGNLVAEGALAKVLETARSGAALGIRAADGAWQLTTSFSFRASDLPCRRYEMSNEAIGRFGGYACRSRDGRWLVHAQMTLDKQRPGGTGFTPAAGDDDAALDAAIRAAMDGDVLRSEEEAQLIADRWTNSRN